MVNLLVIYLFLKNKKFVFSHLTKLSDSEYILMGITIIGRRQTLRDEAKKYE